MLASTLQLSNLETVCGGRRTESRSNMAYHTAVFSLLQLLEEMSQRECFIDRQEIECLHEKFSQFQALTQDHSPKDKEAATCLESRLRDAAYEALDIIEYHNWEQIEKLELGIVGNKCQGLDKVKEEVDVVVKELARMKKTLSLLDSYSVGIGTKEQTPGGESTMVGFCNRLVTIKEQLLGEPSTLQIISLAGMGGIGKTTLARNIFQDKSMFNHFDCRAWATVSQDFHLRKVLLAMINSMNIMDEKLKAQGEDVLGEYIYKHLKRRRFLIVIDDLWDARVWDDIKWILPNDSNGSRVIVTTRLSDVACYAAGGSFHHMELLSDIESWKLLRKKVFGDELYPDELVDIGIGIARSCRGLPLAIVVVAGILKLNKTVHDWEEVARNVSSVVIGNEEHFSKILSLSYNHLPHHLKACFLYMGGFPEDCQIPVSRLIKLWAAEGFLKPSSHKTLEQLGNEYLVDLVNRNLVSITRHRSNGMFKRCIVHDLLRNLSSQRGRNENFLLILDQKDDSCVVSTRNLRRLFVYYANGLVFTREEGDRRPQIRSVICMCYTKEVLSFVSDFKLLRVLDIEELKSLALFPVQIVELFHLRYLAVRVCVLVQPALPPSICKLQNLQTLIIGLKLGFTDSDRCLLLPTQIWKMPNLRHVMINQLKLSPVPCDAIINREAYKMENLQTLLTAVDLRFSRDIVVMIPKLKKLKVSYSRIHDNKWHKFCLHNLVHLYQLETLDISFFRIELGAKVSCLQQAESFPECFAFPLSLIKLSLSGCRLPWKDLTVVGILPHLEVLVLLKDALVGKEWEPVEGEFSNLKFLLMEGLNLEHWGAESCHFPRLKHLKISKCKNLQEIPTEIGEIPTLEVIEVADSKSVETSVRLIQEEQKELGNEELRVIVTPTPPFSLESYDGGLF